MSSRTTSWAQRSRASACERRRIASSVRADVKPTVTSFSFASWRIATYSSTMYSDTSGVTLGSNCAHVRDEGAEEGGLDGVDRRRVRLVAVDVRGAR